MSSISFANEFQSEDLLRSFTLNPTREFSGNFEGTDDFTLSHAGKLVFREIQNKFILTMVSNGNRHAHRSNLLYPKSGNVKFSVLNNNPDSFNEYKTFGYDFDGEMLELSLAPADKTFYVMESDGQYKRRLHQLAKLGRNYEVTGKYFGVAKFTVQGIQKIDFYEILPQEVQVSNQDYSKVEILPQVILRGTFSGKDIRLHRGYWRR
jgi:hypothetical protein